MKCNVISGLEVVENDVYLRTRSGRTATLFAKIEVVEGAGPPAAELRIGVVGSPVCRTVRVTSDDFVDGEFDLSDVHDELHSVAYGIGKTFGLDVYNASPPGADNIAWTLADELAGEYRELVIDQTDEMAVFRSGATPAEAASGASPDDGQPVEPIEILPQPTQEGLTQ
ncbi:hypothetical protein QN345_03465 [Cryobacterium sp. 10I1]|uniref:hypothetical protein n=1 Tax=Cryobacterium sp. 10I1 TaxID=3048578 RepID=UPI002B231BDA|nr:hypothetical protein [Cryobacterium sp. 10I1]MEB0304390.1 hypothetical protein [Cryobacterium sp. 10I1]